MLRRIRKLPHRSLLASSAVLLIAAGLGIYFAFFHKASQPVIPSTNPLGNSSPSGSSNPSSNSSANQSSQSSGTPSSSPTASGPPPMTPYGTFVSNHHPGGSYSTAEASTCNTTPGATCYIQFTNGDVTKKLNVETTDARGAAIWYWDVNTAGLSSGSWTVTAVATLNGQTKTASDLNPLVVQ